MELRIIIHFVEQSSRIRAEFARLAFDLGHHAEVYADICELAAHPPRDGIIIARDDVEPGGVGSLLERLTGAGIWLPLVAAGECHTTGRIVEAIKAGAIDYLRLPLEAESFAATLARVGSDAGRHGETRKRMIDARNLIERLSVREREVLECLAAGCSNKEIARALDISPRTVEIHRANMMGKLGARHAADAVRVKLEAQVDQRIG